MIVIPRVLREQLSATEETTQKKLALAFAQHVVDTLVNGSTAAAFVDFLDSVRGFVQGENSIAVVAASYESFYRGWPKENAAHSVGSVVRLAGLVGCQRDLEQAGSIARFKYVPKVWDVAREAQRAMGRWSCPRGHGNIDRRAVYRIEWEEARWQLLRTIECTPNPHEQGGT